MSSPADAAARRQAAVAAAAALEPLAGYPAAVVADPVLDAWRATFASQAAAFQNQSIPPGASLSAATASALGGGYGVAGAAAASLLGQPAAGMNNAGGGLRDLLRPMPLPSGLLAPPTNSSDGGHKSWGQYRSETQTSVHEAVERQRKAKEDKSKKEAEAHEEVEKRRCHLHKKPKDSCKFCQRHKEYVTKETEAKAAAKEKFISAVSKKQSGIRIDGNGPLELTNPKTFGFPPMLQTHIVESTHFKTLMDFPTIEEITHEISNFADTLEPYVQNSTTVPSALFCCAYRLLTMNLTAGQLRRLIESEDNPQIRCAGFLFIRFGLSPDQLWSWVGEYVLDDEELRVSGKDDSAGITTIGEYVESLLTQERYFSTVLPRLPSAIKRNVEARLAQVPQDRRRTKANRRLLDVYGQRGVRIEACLGDGEWRAGETLELIAAEGSRPKVRVRLATTTAATADEGSEEEAVVHLGRVILTDSRFGSTGRRSSTDRGGRRSRSRSPGGVDWAREKGKSASELLEEHRRREQDRAVCSSGKEYARRPVSFQVALPMEQGNASKGLTHDRRQEHYVQSGEPRPGGRVDRSRSPDRVRTREQNVEYQARMRQLFEKYGAAKAPTQEDSSRRNDIEGPDVMRLG